MHAAHALPCMFVVQPCTSSRHLYWCAGPAAVACCCATMFAGGHAHGSKSQLHHACHVTSSSCLCALAPTPPNAVWCVYEYFCLQPCQQHADHRQLQPSAPHPLARQAGGLLSLGTAVRLLPAVHAAPAACVSWLHWLAMPPSCFAIAGCHMMPGHCLHPTLPCPPAEERRGRQ